MLTISNLPPFSGLRGHLRCETRTAHDNLDRELGAVGWATRHDYGEFLLCQYTARRPIEEWVERNLDPRDGPPAQTGLISADLFELGMSAQVNGVDQMAAEIGGVRFSLPLGSTPLGLNWAVAGSSLGNRSILAELRKHEAAESPASFLSDPAMVRFWKELQPQLGEIRDPQTFHAATIAALAVFDHFLRAVRLVRASYLARAGALA